MKIHSDTLELGSLHPVTTMGMFDGLHLGHRMLLNRLKALSEERKKPSLVISFWPHPRMVLNPNDQSLFYLNTLDEKIALLESIGIDHLLVLGFNREFASQTACEFIQSFLIEKLKIDYLLVGYNHHFGKDRMGSFNDLKQCSGKDSFGIEKYDAYQWEGMEVSSTLVRKHLQEGNIGLANQLLGYAYPLSGRIVPGNQIGQQIGFPTANLEPDDPRKLIPATGVYAIEAAIEHQTYQGMLNIGYRPTIEETEKTIRIEAHLIDFNRTAYGESIQIRFREKIRDEKRFDNLNQLREQLLIDLDTVKKQIIN